MTENHNNETMLETSESLDERLMITVCMRCSTMFLSSVPMCFDCLQTADFVHNILGQPIRANSREGRELWGC